MVADLVYPVSAAPLYPRPSIERPGPQAFPKEEMLPLVEPTGQVYGQASRAWCHSGAKPLHPVVHLHIADPEGRVCLQKRAETKDLLPGYWDTAVGGHVSYGEQVGEALYREAAEELGLVAFSPILLDSYIYESARDRELIFVFGLIGHPRLVPGADEVSRIRWWTPQELDEAWGKKQLTPNFEEEFPRIRQRLLALL